MNTVIVYNSRTGFTETYARQLAAALDGRAIPLREAQRAGLGSPDVVIFGTRAHCGGIDRLGQGLRLLRQSGAGRGAFFVTGAVPAEAEQEIAALWARNLREDVPHFYVPAGLRYEGMGFTDRLLMRVFAFMLGRKKDKSESERQMERSIASSYDFSSPDFFEPVLTWARS